ncbi:hypothetical protein ES703_80914 [subsurface metagenome]
MVVQVRIYSKGMKRRKQVKLLGTEADLGWDIPFAILTFNHVGTGVSIQEVLDMGLTNADIKSASKEPQEFGIKLFKLKEKP